MLSKPRSLFVAFICMYLGLYILIPSSVEPHKTSELIAMAKMRSKEKVCYKTKLKPSLKKQCKRWGINV